MIARAIQSGYREDLEDGKDVWSKEFQNLLVDFKKMLIALRFGNPAYHKGSKEKEYSNLIEAKALIEESGNERGIGVCNSNLANCVRGMTREQRSKLNTGDAVQIMTDAVR